MIGPPMISRWLQNRDRASCGRRQSGSALAMQSEPRRRATRRPERYRPARRSAMSELTWSCAQRTLNRRRWFVASEDHDAPQDIPIKVEERLFPGVGDLRSGRPPTTGQAIMLNPWEAGDIARSDADSDDRTPFRNRFRARRRVCQGSNYVIVPPVGWCRGLRAPITNRLGAVAPAGYLDERSHLNGALVLPSQRGSLWTI